MHRVVVSAVLLLLSLVLAPTGAQAQSRSFDCGESSLTGRQVTVVVNGPQSVTAGRIYGRTVTMRQAGADPYHFVAPGLSLTVSADQREIKIMGRGGESVGCYVAGGPPSQPGADASSCPAGTKPVPETDNCVPDRPARAPASSCPAGTRPIPETDDCEPIRGAVVPGSPLLGTWVQVELSGGDCPTCQITISDAGKGLLLTSSNGWSARLVAGQDGDAGAASGQGRWGRGGGAFAGRPLTVDLQLTRRRLRMTLSIETGGRPTVVQASFVPR